MGAGKYIFVFTLLLINILGLIYLLPFMQSISFFRELIFLILFVILSFVFINATKKNFIWTWVFSAFLFSLALINIVYLILLADSKLLVLLLITNVIGFICYC